MLVRNEKLPLPFGRRLALKPLMFSSFLTMTQTKTRASHFKGRLFKSAATSTLALSAVAGGVLLSGGEAKALTCPFDSSISQQFSIISCSDGTTNPNPPLNGGTVYDNTWHDTNDLLGNLTPTDKQIKFISGPTGGKGNIEWQWLDINGNGTWRIPPDPISKDVWKVDVDFNPVFNLPLPNGIGANPSIFEYIVRITEPDYFFHDVFIGADFIAGDGISTVTKDIYTANGHLKGDLLGTLTCTGLADGSSTCDDPLVVPGHLQKLYIVDTATYGGRPIDNYSNSFRQQTKVPAPLPILGAAAAFGSIRKARKFSTHLKTFSMS
jgi:hypothetical protein